MPFDDWQFYVVSLAALWGLWAVLRPFLPGRAKSDGCPSCPAGGDTGATAKKKRSTLTIFGKKPSRKL